MLIWSKQIVLHVLVYVVFALLDSVWLGIIMKDFYLTNLGDKARVINGAIAPYWPVALLVWGLLVVGIFYFVLPLSQSIAHAFFCGAAYGLIIYGVYDLTNLATFAHWPLALAICDICWGVVINGSVSAFAYFIFNR